MPGQAESTLETGKIRADLETIFHTEGLKPLLLELQEKDFAYYTQVDKKNHRRVIRALEFIRLNAKPFSAFRLSRKATDIRLLKLLILPSKAMLHAFIRKRTERMFKNDGLIEEVRNIYNSADCLLGEKSKLHEIIGIAEAVLFIKNAISLEEAIEQCVQKTKSLAKRQVTFLKQEKNMHIFLWNNHSPMFPKPKHTREDDWKLRDTFLYQENACTEISGLEELAEKTEERIKEFYAN